MASQYDDHGTLKEVARRENRTTEELLEMIEKAKPPEAHILEAVRVFLRAYFSAVAEERTNYKPTPEEEACHQKYLLPA